MSQLSSMMGGMEGSLTRDDMRSAFEASHPVRRMHAWARGPGAARRQALALLWRRLYIQRHRLGLVAVPLGYLLPVPAHPTRLLAPHPTQPNPRPPRRRAPTAASASWTCLRCWAAATAQTLPTTTTTSWMRWWCDELAAELAAALALCPGGGLSTPGTSLCGCHPMHAKVSESPPDPGCVYPFAAARRPRSNSLLL